MNKILKYLKITENYVKNIVTENALFDQSVGYACV